MATAARECNNPDCSFNKDGRCAEDEDPETCPFRGARPLILGDDGEEDDEQEVLPVVRSEDNTDDEDEVGDPRDDEFSGSMLSLPTGERLSPLETTLIMMAAPTRVISFVAPQEAGKTSLIAGIYEMFLEGRQTGALYRGSRTLPGFERLCHLSRAASGRTEAGMPRTRRAEGLGYFHLDLDVAGERLGLLLGDRPGENYVRASASIDEAQELSEVRTASTVVYLIDGKALIDPKTKTLPHGQAISVLDAMAEADLMRSRPALAVVLTKADLVEGVENAFDRFDKIVENLTKRYAGRFGKVTGYRTSASPTPPTDAFPRGEGVADLFVDLLEDVRSPLSAPISVAAPRRSFQALGKIHG